ncbi:MAG TPA: response regulator transcription factor [Zoogloea sp.]|jgi:two-component system invasion response regulator UvrY|uniref:response regulator transcription factor n=1 Tax=Zoogloea sp. TaxID=49181 RepID=UPI001B59F7BA|nr:response regulator transcription factor [Zoogloea sp.]MBP8266255.1 response regulator transcription factor [Zoogloea sp.]HOB46782.1 response regulator transcription factor [Zoogloea sp.]HQA11003.1 response regulator transcription factor [Zoogloea sp.]HQE39421.1 response regulator transcription factor [Zoogloea sp.]
MNYAHTDPRLDELTLVLADDHAIVRLGFRLLLEGVGARVLAEADSGEAAQRLVAELKPDVLVMDLSMPGCGGLSALERILARQPDARVLIASAHTDPLTAERTLKAGAAGYLCKRSSPDELLRAVALVAAGQRYLDPDIAAQLHRADRPEHPAEALTDKEFHVFLQLAQGRSVAEVADTFHLSPNTVGTHLYRIKQKLGIQNMAELAMAAVRAGVIEV